MTKRRWLARIVKAILIILLIPAAGIIVFLTCSTKVTRNLDTYIYSLPFEQGKRFKVVQGYGGLFSHRYIAAIDFRMPAGTPVCAARGGVVYSYKDNSDEGGFLSKYKNKANYIMIRHDDGSIGCYWHLQKNGVLVKSGTVAKGQVIGYSGATGQVIQPHLHFSVKRVLNYNMNSFVRTSFQTSEGVKLLKRGQWYERPDKTDNR